MPWYINLLILFAFALSAALLCQAIQNRFARRTLRNWTGTGINQDLTPLDISVLLGRHPGVVVSLLFFRLMEEGKARVLSEVPLRVEWTADRQLDPFEIAFAASVGPEGEFDAEGVFALLEVIYDRANEAMIGYSGRATAVYWRDHAKRLSAEVVRTGQWAPQSFPWLLIRDPNSIWDLIEDSPEGRKLKELVRIQSRCVHHMVDAEKLKMHARRAKEGFFAYPREILGSMAEEVPHGWQFRRLV